jgi:thymidylate synthase (FAD)
MARVSNPANQDNWDTGPKLLGYLIKHKHWSPFELVSMCVQIETERDIAAQILRHRSFSFQELSTRYTQTGQAAPIELRRQDTKNRQNSFDDLPEDVVKRFTSQIHVLTRNLYLTYEKMLQAGVAKECARRILPLCTPHHPLHGRHGPQLDPLHRTPHQSRHSEGAPGRGRRL